MAGETNQAFTATISGSYAVIVDDGICSDTSACVDVEVIIIGIDDLMSNTIKIAPNPFDNTINISGLIGDEHFQLYNATGQLMVEGNQIANAYFADLIAGIYFLHIENDNYKVIKSIVKQ